MPGTVCSWEWPSHPPVTHLPSLWEMLQALQLDPHPIPKADSIVHTPGMPIRSRAVLKVSARYSKESPQGPCQASHVTDEKVKAQRSGQGPTANN